MLGLRRGHRRAARVRRPGALSGEGGRPGSAGAGRGSRLSALRHALISAAGNDSVMGRDEHERAVRFRTARRDPELTVIEGFHALKHALRFGAELVEAVAVEPASLDAMAGELAPDLAGQLTGRV